MNTSISNYSNALKLAMVVGGQKAQNQPVLHEIQAYVAAEATTPMTTTDTPSITVAAGTNGEDERRPWATPW